MTTEIRLQNDARIFAEGMDISALCRQFAVCGINTKPQPEGFTPDDRKFEPSAIIPRWGADGAGIEVKGLKLAWHKTAWIVVK